MFLFLSNEYEIIAAILFVLAYIGLRLFSRPKIPRLSYLAIFAVMSVVLNPQLIRIALVDAHFPYIVYRGDSELRSFAAGLVALVTGICAGQWCI